MAALRGHYERHSMPAVFGRGRTAGRARAYRAFVPDPIAGISVLLDTPAAARCDEAARLLAELDGDPQRTLPLEGMAGQLMRSEALASSAIEGLVVSHRKLARAAFEGAAGNYRAREVLNAVEAVQYAIDEAATAPVLSEETIYAMHARIASGTILASYTGRWRDEQSWIGGPGPHAADYVPPHHTHVERLMADWLAFANDRVDIVPIAHVAIAHAQFETIHPFPDGNGRTGRALIQAQLRRRRVVSKYLPPISLVLAADRRRYFAGLTAFQGNEISEWCGAFADACCFAAEQAAGFTDVIRDLQDDWKDAVGPLRSDAAALKVIAALPSYPILNVATVQQIADCSDVAAGRALARLEASGVLKRYDNRKRGRSWEAPRLFELLRSFEDALRTAEAA